MHKMPPNNGGQLCQFAVLRLRHGLLDLTVPRVHTEHEPMSRVTILAHN